MVEDLGDGDLVLWLAGITLWTTGAPALAAPSGRVLVLVSQDALPYSQAAGVLLLVDGRRLNDPVYDNALIGTEGLIDVDLIERVEVVRRDLGVLIYLDDFGTGYSSLSYLPRFSITALKIDGSFVARMNDHSADLEVARGITTIAHNLKMDVIAEGIETSEQMASVLALPCYMGQGWLFCPGVSAERAGELLAEANTALP